MIPKELLLLLILLGIFVSTSIPAAVYKHTNPDGSVTFSDVPPKINDKPIKLPPSTTYTPPQVPRSETSVKPKKVEEKYESISITSPANDTALRDNAGNITINYKVEPLLKPGHSYVLKMDGKNVGEGKSESIQLNNIDRGSHTFIAQVVDEDKKIIIQSTPVVVHLQRASIIP